MPWLSRYVLAPRTQTSVIETRSAGLHEERETSAYVSDMWMGFACTILSPSLSLQRRAEEAAGAAGVAEDGGEGMKNTCYGLP